MISKDAKHKLKLKKSSSSNSSSMKYHNPLHTINQAQKQGNRKSDMSVNRDDRRGTSFLSKLTNKFSRR